MVFDQAGNKMYSTYGDALIKTTPWDSLPEAIRKLLGGKLRLGELEAASMVWIWHPLLLEGV